MYENPRTIWASDYWYDAEPECPYDDSMDAEDAYLLWDAEMKELIAEADELQKEAEELPF